MAALRPSRSVPDIRPPSDEGRREERGAGAANRAYFFETKEDRDAFEAEPEKYVAAAPGAGQVMGSEDHYRHRRRRGGC